MTAPSNTTGATGSSGPSAPAGAPPAPPAPPPAPLADDEQAAFAFVQAVETAVEALQSIRSRLSGKKDATAATGHMLEALLMAGGSLRDYDRSKVWALRHAIGGESFAFRSEYDAAVVVLVAVVQGLRPTESPEAEARKQTSRAEIEAITRRLVQCGNAVESTRALDDWDRGVVAAKSAIDKAAHEARMAAGFNPASSPLPRPSAPPSKSAARKPGSREPAVEGDFPLPGGVEAGANPFPTTKVG